MRISLCLLVWNELAGCQALVKRLPLAKFDEVYAVDGGSIDGTVEYLRDQGIVVHRQPTAGLGAATRHAFEVCGADAVVFFHPDGNMDPEDVTRFRGLFDGGMGLVVASRMGRDGRNEEDGQLLKPRKWFVLLLAGIAALLWRREGPVMWDVVNGFRGATKDAFGRMDIRGMGCTVDYEMVIRSYKLRLPRGMFSTVEGPRLSGETRFKSLPTGLAELRLLWKEIWRD
jgi:glycosyltransferase involved in cell wall biosynthesis